MHNKEQGQEGLLGLFALGRYPNPIAHTVNKQRSLDGSLALLWYPLLFASLSVCNHNEQTQKSFVETETGSQQAHHKGEQLGNDECLMDYYYYCTENAIYGNAIRYAIKRGIMLK